MIGSSSSGKITEILLRRGSVSAEVLAAAEEDARLAGQRIERYLVEKGLIRHEDMALTIAEYLNLRPISLAHFLPEQSLRDVLPMDLMTRYRAIPVGHVGHVLTLAVDDPFDLPALDEIKAAIGLALAPVVAPEHEIQEVLGKLQAEQSQGLKMEEIMQEEGDIEVLDEQRKEQSLDEMLQSAEGAPVIRMVNLILIEALRSGSSDIHIEPMERKVRLRYRIDGNMIERPGPPKNLQAAVISRIKIMSDLNIAERRVPQDGRFNIKALRKEVDIRVSILPTVHGEKVVMRILDKGSLAPSLNALGLDEVAQKAMQYAITQPHGIILVTGPTGSGKTTTLYSCLQDLNKPDVNIITCEDPVEYQVEGINQVQVHNEVGLTFASSLRSILRQDPDIVLVGEIRDSETADIAVKAALTGHLVLSTLHTNDAPGAVTRLIDMGVEPFMLGASLILTQAQRLYRKLCPICKKPTTIAPDILAANHVDPHALDGATLYRPVGCPRCTGGFKGRGAIMEVLVINDAIRDAVLRGANAAELRRLGQANGMVSLKEAGLSRVREGITSLEATLEVTGGE